MNPHLNILTWLLLILSFTVVNSDPRETFAGSSGSPICGDVQEPKGTLIPTFVQAMERLSSALNNSNSNFAVANVTVSNSPLYALVQCHRDLSRTDCLVCYAVSRTAIPVCLLGHSGRIFLNGCFVRYDNYSFYHETVDPATDATNCISDFRNLAFYDFEGGIGEFNRSVLGMVDNITQLALNNSGFSVLKSNGVYGLAQCWESLSTEECRVCLDKARREVVKCVPSTEGRSMNAGCFLRYSIENFFSNDTESDGGSSGSTHSSSSGTTRKVIIGITCSITGIIFLLLFVILCQKKWLHVTPKGPEAANDQIEIFIKNHGTLAHKRYKYSEIKKMTNSFQEKLGRGGFGSVYKGQLHDGKLVAVKLLSETTGDGEDFINEVASISRTSHVHIVTLLGFCFEGKKRALLYEFMQNRSLDKFLRGDDSHLDWNTLFQIAKGIARGLEYLHRGCNTRIVHFDIKPHNILLNEEFVPKISDFGLAKLCKTKESIVSVFGARGTAGYMAPEVFFRSLGGASHKSDVYSYGMMVLEMTGAGKHNNDKSTSTSEAYFPDWIYKQVEAGANLEDYGVTTEWELESARTMMTVGLWCIQYDPSDRPSISKVVEMLEGSLETLQVPPRRFWSSPTRSAQGISQLDRLSLIN